MNFFDHKNLGNHLLQLCPKVVKHPVYIYTYLLTPWSRVLLEKLTGFAANQEIPRILWSPKVHYFTHKRPHIYVYMYKILLSQYHICYACGLFIYFRIFNILIGQTDVLCLYSFILEDSLRMTPLVPKHVAVQCLL